MTTEPGQTTSEWFTLLGAVGTTGVGLLVTVLGNHAHFLTTSDVDAIRNFLIAADALAVGYILSRGVRKAGTSA